MKTDNEQVFPTPQENLAEVFPPPQAADIVEVFATPQAFPTGVFPPPQAFPAGTFAPPQEANRTKEDTVPKPSPIDLILALVLLVLGFCFWDWNLLATTEAGFGTTVFFLCATAMSFVYLQIKRIKQNAISLLMLLVVIVGALQFALNGERDINFLLILFETSACLLWVMYSCRNSISNKLSGLIVWDLFNQGFIVAFANIFRIFSQPLKLSQGRKKIWLSLLYALIGFMICIPAFFIVVSLLSFADDGFGLLVDDFFGFLDKTDVFDVIFKIFLGIPLAAYIFGVIFGNFAKRHTASLKASELLQVFEKAHVLPKAALYLPLAIFVALYIIFFIAMGSYFFSGVQGTLPVQYTYAEYARQGFFELCFVAVINLLILCTVWLFAKRGADEYPLILKILSGLIALLTCLLIVTAMSKMFLYIQSYSLTPLRLYTSWFMLFLLLVFLLLLAWHFKPFNAARPIIVLATVFILALGLVNTNALVANHNVDRYLLGHSATIDIELLASLGDPAVPALYRIEEYAEDSKVRMQASSAIEDNKRMGEATKTHEHHGLTTWNAWHKQSLQSLRSDWLYAKR